MGGLVGTWGQARSTPHDSLDVLQSRALSLVYLMVGVALPSEENLALCNWKCLSRYRMGCTASLSDEKFGRHTFAVVK